MSHCRMLTTSGPNDSGFVTSSMKYLVHLMNPSQLVLSIVVLSNGIAFAQNYQHARQQLVQKHIESAGVSNSGVLDAMRTTPRHEFLPNRKRQLAYYDMALPIGFGQTISSPYIVAFMTEQLEPQETDRVLEIGTGSGYQAAVLSPLVKEVYSIEIVEPLGKQAARTLKRLGYENVFTKIGDGFAGWEEHAPFDKIIVTCSPENIPTPLVEQLAEGGQMIIPVGERFQQTLCRFRKTDGQLVREPLQATFFVPMTGEAESRREIQPNSAQPNIVHGGFEKTLSGTESPAGWYYLRGGRVVPDSEAPEQSHVLQFKNDVPGLSAHTLQAIGIDGFVVESIEIELWTKGRNIRSGTGKDQAARLLIEFYSENRAAIRHANLGPWGGSFDWTKRKRRIPVPRNARLAVIGVGLLGATGQLWVDDVKLTVIEK